MNKWAKEIARMLPTVAVTFGAMYLVNRYAPSNVKEAFGLDD